MAADGRRHTQGGHQPTDFQPLDLSHTLCKFGRVQGNLQDGAIDGSTVDNVKSLGLSLGSVTE
jgi:hypothetical protein